MPKKNKIVDKFYPFIKEKAKPIDEKERKDIINGRIF